MNDERFVLGSRLGLQSFLEELQASRGRIENEDAPAFDVIVDLLEECIERLRVIEAGMAE